VLRAEREIDQKFDVYPHEGYTGTIRNNIYVDLKQPDKIWFFDDCLSCVARKETRLAGDTPTGIELH
jgi:hypothetical protein